MILRSTYNVAEICSQLGVSHAVLSPGSRCAPLTLAFARHPSIACKTISDERSAAFIALGIAQQTQAPTVLICTSGSAALNYAPAIAEAYFQQVPLLVFTADRPPEWIDQLDGQTIRQENIYQNHIKRSYHYPVATDHQDAQWHGDRMISEAVNLANQYPAGPVHINFPFREPFYPSNDEEISFDKNVKVIHESAANSELLDSDWNTFLEHWQNTQRKMIIGGQYPLNEELTSTLSQLSTNQKIPVVGDIISNLHEVEEVIAHSDLILGSGKKGLKESLEPELIVTFGLSTISKSLKLFLRAVNCVHWHIQPAGDYADTYQSLQNVLRTSPESFFKKLAESETSPSFDSQKQENFYHLWLIEERKVNRFLNAHFPGKTLGEFAVVNALMEKIKNSDLHLANSMAIRYANYIGIKPGNQVQVFANRGTSGIDGSTSTAVGASLVSNKQTVLLTGDLAFFYDSNAFWHNYPLENLKIVILNNHAGGIFRLIPGPSQQPELEEYFETHQKRTARLLAEEFNLNYVNCSDLKKLSKEIDNLLTSKGPAILEVETDSKQNQEFFEQFKKAYQEFDD